MLFISGELLDAIKAEGEKAYPNECCGILFGLSGEAEEKTVMCIQPIVNAHSEDEQYHRFLITPENMLEAEKKARTLKLDVVGFYHSHPDHPARPSDFDREHALPFYSYIITAVEKGAAQEVTSWNLRDDRLEFNAEKVIIKTQGD